MKLVQNSDFQAFKSILHENIIATWNLCVMSVFLYKSKNDRDWSLTFIIGKLWICWLRVRTGFVVEGHI